MKTCRYCGRENPDIAATCVACSTPFSATPATETKADPALSDPALNPVVVAKFSNLQQASVLAGRLNDAGIEAWIPEEYSEQTFSGVVGLERLTVQVAAKDYKTALAVMAETATPDAESSDTDLAGAQTTSGTAEFIPISGPRKLCVSCGKPIAIDATLCPHCGYTQPPAASENS